jgi:hypothetical protein
VSIKRTILAFGASLVVSGAAMGSYVTANWADNHIHFLDANFNSTGSFSTGGSLPNGVAVGGGLIFSGHFIGQEVRAFDMNGVLQFTWSHPQISFLQGLEYISGAEIAVASDGIHFFNPLTGAFVRSIPSAEGGTVEGLAYNGAGTLFQLGSSAIYATDVNNGNLLYTLPNPAVGNPFGGTGIAYIGGNALAVASANGNWYTIDALSGALISSGNNGIEMYGLAFIPAPGAMALLGIAGLFGARRRRE